MNDGLSPKVDAVAGSLAEISVQVVDGGVDGRLVELEGLRQLRNVTSPKSRPTYLVVPGDDLVAPAHGHALALDLSHDD